MGNKKDRMRKIEIEFIQKKEELKSQHLIDLFNLSQKYNDYLCNGGDSYV